MCSNSRVICYGKVAVVIPIFNVDKYLQQCLDSVVGQTYPYFTLFAVNDGSEDDSLSILERYAIQDSRIIIINKQNGGVSSARNAALNEIQHYGDYKFVYFLDADDYIDKTLLWEFVYYLTETNSDYGVCAYKKITSTSIESRDKKTHFLGDYILMNSQDIAEQFFRISDSYDFGDQDDETTSLFLNNRFFRLDNIINMRFNERLSACEDQDFLIRSMKFLGSGVKINHVLFYYRRRLSSLSNMVDVKKDDLQVYESYFKFNGSFPLYIRKGIQAYYLQHRIQKFYSDFNAASGFSEMYKLYHCILMELRGNRFEFNLTKYVKKHKAIFDKGFIVTLFYVKARNISKKLVFITRKIRFYR